MAKRYYEVLGIKENATQKDIKNAFRELSKKWHPDKFTNKTKEEQKEAENKFKEINEAYQVLYDKEKRAKYDMYGDNFNSVNIENDSFDGFSRMAEHFRNMANDFGFNGGGQAINRGSDVIVKVSINLKDVYNNTKKKIRYEIEVPCESCNGTGNADKQIHKCSHCNGSGVFVNTRVVGSTIYREQTYCPYCNGTGRDNESSIEKCKVCGGSGTRKDWREIEVVVNLNWLMNNNLRINGGGNIPSGDNPVPGNLILSISYNDYDNFLVDNKLNIVKEVEVPIITCILGGDIEVKSIDDKINKVKIKSGIKDGTTLRLKGKGLPQYNNNNTDFLIIVKHKMPQTLDEKEKEILNNLKDKPNFN